MDRNVKRDITKRYRRLLENLSFGNVGQEDTFECQDCGRRVKTIVRDEGAVPQGITCPYCDGECAHTDDAKDVPVTHEWYRPSLDEVLQMAEKQMFSVLMILNGGLIRRAK